MAEALFARVAPLTQKGRDAQYGLPWKVAVMPPSRVLEALYGTGCRAQDLLPISFLLATRPTVMRPKERQTAPGVYYCILQLPIRQNKTSTERRVFMLLASYLPVVKALKRAWAASGGSSTRYLERNPFGLGEPHSNADANPVQGQPNLGFKSCNGIAKAVKGMCRGRGGAKAATVLQAILREAAEGGEDEPMAHSEQRPEEYRLTAHVLRHSRVQEAEEEGWSR